MKRQMIIGGGILLLGGAIVPVTSQAAYAPHNETNAITYVDCHDLDGLLGLLDSSTLNSAFLKDCEVCHVNSSGGGFSKNSAPAVLTHSNAVIGSNQYNDWSRDCWDCHGHGRPEAALGNGDFSNAAYDGGTDTTFFTVSYFAPVGTDWNDPLKWDKKTGNERGLLLSYTYFDITADKDMTVSAEIVDATTADITVKGDLTMALSGAFTISYGQMIKPSINGIPVAFTDSSDLAYNETFPADDTTLGVCQACHTQTRYWRNDGTLTDHNNGFACTYCHSHEEGFKPSCNGCHGEPPIINSLGGPDGLVDTPAPTGSQTDGAHALHATEGGYNFSCETCHTGGMLTQIVLNGGIDVGFDASVRYDGYLGPLAPQYDGQTVVSYNGDVSVAPSGAMTCSNVYCHSMGKTAAMGYDVAQDSAAWDTPGPLACDSCHTSPPLFDLHVFHANWGVGDCSICHNGTTTDGTTIADKSLHVNGQYDVIPSDTFINHLGQAIPFSFIYTYAPGGGTCSSNSCHTDSVHIGPSHVWHNRDLFLDASLNQSATLDSGGAPICGSMDFTATVVSTQDTVAPFTCDYDFDGDGVFNDTADCATPVAYDYTEGGTVAITWDTLRDLTWTASDANGTTLAENSRTEQVIVCPSPNILPTVQGTVAMTYAGNFEVRLTDTSFDPDFDQFNRTGPGRIRINWGDGSPVEELDIDLIAIAASHIFLHNYPVGGGYFVNYSIKDNALSTQWVDSPAKYVYVSF